MRRHAKASSADLPQTQTGSLGSIVREALALHVRKPDGARGGGLTLALLTIVITGLLGVGSAFAAVPTVSFTSVSAVTAKTAVLEAQINPEGEATTYHFEYGLADCSANPCSSIPLSEASVGSGSTVVKVARELQGLQPYTTYHYRVVATNTSGPTAGSDRVLHTYAVGSANTNCPNQAFRLGAAAQLPNCRAYEMVTPVNKGGSDILGVLSGFHRGEYNQGNPSGSKLTFGSAVSFGDQASSINANQYLSSRGENGWTTRGLNAPAGEDLLESISEFTAVNDPFMAFTEDLSKGLLINETQLTPDAMPGLLNVYRQNTDTRSFTALTNSTPTAVENAPYLEEEIQGMSADGSDGVFVASAALTPNAATTGGRQVYDFANGQLHLVSVLPDGAASEIPSNVGTHYFQIGGFDREDDRYRAVSEDGSRIFWTTSFGDFGSIFVRKNPAQPQSAINGGGECTEPAKACTIPVSGSVTSERAIFWTADTTGSTAVFEVMSGPEAGDLYEFDVETETPTLIAHHAGSLSGGARTGGVVGASRDLSYIYFTSEDVLAPGATAGEANLYVDHKGIDTYIATLPLSDGDDNGMRADNFHPIWRTSRVTPDGRHMIFQTTGKEVAAQAAGYDNTDASSGEQDMEVYVYAADTQALNCVSCNPSGGQPLGRPLLEPYPQVYEGSGQATGITAAGWIPSWEHSLYPSRLLSDDGNRAFFDSFEALVPGDTNGKQDVYQWERAGSGGCSAESGSFSVQDDGCISLISSGESARNSEFVEADATGDNVFIRTESGLDPRDPGLLDLYDARVNGGFAIPTAAPACEGETCQGTPTPPSDATPASSAYSGPGNASEKAGRKKHRRKHSKKRHHRHSHQRTAKSRHEGAK